MKLLSTCFALLTLVLGMGTMNAAEIDTTPLAIKPVRVFSEIMVDRPIVVTYANDGTDRVFVASQKGKIHVFENDADVEEDDIFFDLTSKVVYNDDKNEEGLLGFAFHPNYKETGEIFIYYTTTDAPNTSVISKFKVSADDPGKIDPASEVEIWRLPQPYWNHNGGTIAFGPDGYLYIGLGDGGKGGDPHKNGQNLGTWLGSILRIDVDKTSGKKEYSIPKDNPFINTNGAKPEIYAYGLRNVWRLAFDRKTGVCWAGDVGQNLWEEIDIIVKGGNYGWNDREGMHQYENSGVDANDEMIEPIWEYHHDIGKSITGGLVYRGTKLPELEGAYIYADYVTGKIWALWYDFDKKEVVANREIQSENLPIMSFGDDAAGEIYFTTPFGAMYTFEKAE
ncbi:Quinoprotein glucose dehydrogenase B precursor [Polystyrenella longa]|uniref:Quinoprotein glucose dehydrogenase B n=1 Tax=Polystyrenella longa TaxID=2528007 RepID=A0A518CIT2_9PLAN|nr:PQQ-dependent sugar dehydrogenase [Polystyrenella longa]QDU79145.1 Quinoprotein glucose dehydrogenase B precursor [Polystyrenella longa]